MAFESADGTEKKERSRIKGEYAFEFTENGQEGKWLHIFGEDGAHVEGAHFVPAEARNGEMIVFHPGLPGDSVTWFEEKDVPLFLREGYEVFVGRHNGLIPVEKNQAYVHNQKLIETGDVGSVQSASVKDWLREPELSLRYFAGKPTTLITHSFGSLAGEYSLARLWERYGEASTNPLGNLRKWVTLGGVTYDLKEDVADLSKGITVETWERYLAWLHGTGIYAMGDTEKALQEFLEGMRYGNEHLKNIPEHIQVISVNTEGDARVGIKAGLDLQRRLGRGLVIDDKTFDKVLFPEGIDPHDIPHMLPETLLRLVRMQISRFPHVAEVSDAGAALSSEILERKFGALKLDVLSQDESHRVSCLRLVSDNRAVACSTVEFHHAGAEKTPGLHARIVGGDMLGKTIKESGIDHTRTESAPRTLEIPSTFKIVFGTEQIICVSRSVEYIVDGEPYATIVEYYNPDLIEPYGPGV